MTSEFCHNAMLKKWKIQSFHRISNKICKICWVCSQIWNKVPGWPLHSGQECWLFLVYMFLKGQQSCPELSIPHQPQFRYEPFHKEGVPVWLHIGWTYLSHRRPSPEKKSLNDLILWFDEKNSCSEPKISDSFKLWRWKRIRGTKVTSVTEI